MMDKNDETSDRIVLVQAYEGTVQSKTFCQHESCHASDMQYRLFVLLQNGMRGAGRCGRKVCVPGTSSFVITFVVVTHRPSGIFFDQSPAAKITDPGSYGYIHRSPCERRNNTPLLPLTKPWPSGNKYNWFQNHNSRHPFQRAFIISSRETWELIFCWLLL